LEGVVPGGPGGSDATSRLAALRAEVDALVARADALPATGFAPALAALLVDLDAIGPRLEELITFAGCHAAAAAESPDAIRAEALVTELASRYARAWVAPAARIAFGPAEEYAQLLVDPRLGAMRGMLQERRRLGHLRLPEAEDALATELSRDAIHAWGSLYDVESGALRIEVDRGQGAERLSAGQARILMHHPDRDVRHRAFPAIVAGWRSVSRTCAAALTHITGWRQIVNQRRGVGPLEDALAAAKIERTTLEAMITAAREAAPLMQRYFRAKARALGTERLAWADLGAPLGAGGGEVRYDAAQDFVAEQFAVFSPAMADFAVRAFRGRWIEVEDRPGKRGGGFCADLPVSGQSRIFMTWGNSDQSVSTLAHELGHAWHNEVLQRVPYVQRRLPMTLAETASTFAEALVREASRARAQSDGERLRLLDGALSDASAFLVNIPARFELELALYDMRREGPLEVPALEARCSELFGRWYGAAVADVDPTFWCSKLHFFISGISFYNFPYLFGYLFSALVYEHFRPLGPAGAPAYDALLARTGDAWAEPIAKEALGVDLGDPATWRAALAGVERDVAAFEVLVGGH
jgi:pepF/M3 family oligoendopeptidase